AQERLQTFMPLLFTVMFAQFPAGLVIYYTWSGFLGVLQQFYILKKVSGEDTSLLRGHSARRKGPKAKHKDAARQEDLIKHGDAIDVEAEAVAAVVEGD